jgi:hypothetical protein
MRVTRRVGYRMAPFRRKLRTDRWSFQPSAFSYAAAWSGVSTCDSRSSTGPEM